MNKSELINAVADKAGITKKFSREILEGLQEIVFDALKSGEDVRLFDSVTFSTKKTSARIGRNPHTGEAMELPSKIVPKCKFGKIIKDVVSE